MKQLQEKHKLLLTVLTVFFLSLLSLSLILLGFRKRNSISIGDSSLRLSKDTIQNIIFDHSQNKVFVITNDNQKIQALKNVTLTIDDKILNQNGNYLILNQYRKDTQSLKATSIIYDLNNEFKEENRVNEEVFFYVGKDFYAYNSLNTNSSYIKVKDEDRLINNQNAQKYYLGAVRDSEYFYALTNKGDVSLIDIKSGQNFKNVFVSFNRTATYFSTDKSTGYFTGINNQKNSAFLIKYPDITLNQSQDTLAEYEVEIPKTPTLLSIRGNIAYASAVIGEGKYTNYKIDFTSKRVKELQNYKDYEEILY